MRVYISADMEGVAGIVSEDQTNPVGKHDYATACALMTAEVRAACEGATAAGATAILVNDSHWNMRNVDHDALPPDVRLVRGSAKPLSMMQGVDEGFDAAVFVGYHAPIGTRDAILDHTYTDDTLYGVWLNGEPCSEARINAAVAGRSGVPVVFLSGDRAACADAQRHLPWARTVAVKDAIGRYAAASLSPQQARASIAAGVELALRELADGGATPYVIAPPIELRLDFTNTARADAAAMMPGAQRIDGRSISYVHDDIAVVFAAFRALMTLGGSA